MAEFIAGRTVDCVGLQARTRQHLQEYNQIIMDRLKNQTPQTGYWFTIHFTVVFHDIFERCFPTKISREALLFSFIVSIFVLYCFILYAIFSLFNKTS